MRDFTAQVGKKNEFYGNSKGEIWFRKRRHLGEIGNIKKVENHEYQVSEECMEEMDVETPKLCGENRNWLSTLTNGHTVTNVTVVN